MLALTGADGNGQGEEEHMPVERLDATLFLAAPGEEEEEEASLDLVEKENDVLTPAMLPRSSPVCPPRVYRPSVVLSAVSTSN